MSMSSLNSLSNATEWDSKRNVFTVLVLHVHAELLVSTTVVLSCGGKYSTLRSQTFIRDMVAISMARPSYSSSVPRCSSRMLPRHSKGYLSISMARSSYTLSVPRGSSTSDFKVLARYRCSSWQAPYILCPYLEVEVQMLLRYSKDHPSISMARFSYTLLAPRGSSTRRSRNS